MATVSATFTFGLPEDVDTDTLLIYSATTETGTYTQVASISYEYGTTMYEYDSTDDTTWYKIRFYNSIDDEYGPYSDPVYGGNFDNAAPFLAVSTTTDGAHYASVADVYDYATLTSEDVTQSQVSKALKRARAVVDLRTAELDIDRLEMWDTEIARKKYNATLRILQEAEINLALGHLYRLLADELIMEMQRDEDEEKPSISIGNTSLSDMGSFRVSQLVPQLMDMADRFSLVGAAMLSSIQPRSLRFTDWEPLRRIPRFKYPWL